MAKEGSRKTSKAMVVCTTPDVCKTPMGKTLPPVPYQIVANFQDSSSVSRNVKFGGDPAFILDQSIITKVTGDEPGTGGGVSSGTNVSTVEPIEASRNVKANGKRIVRHDDKCKMNNSNTFGKVVFQTDGKSGKTNQQESSHYEETIQFVEESTGEPMADYPYKLELESGRIIEGRTNENGCTVKIVTEKPETIYVIEQEDEYIQDPINKDFYPLIPVRD